MLMSDITNTIEVPVEKTGSDLELFGLGTKYVSILKHTRVKDYLDKDTNTLLVLWESMSDLASSITDKDIKFLETTSASFKATVSKLLREKQELQKVSVDTFIVNPDKYKKQLAKVKVILDRNKERLTKYNNELKSVGGDRKKEAYVKVLLRVNDSTFNTIINLYRELNKNIKPMK